MAVKKLQVEGLMGDEFILTRRGNKCPFIELRKVQCEDYSELFMKIYTGKDSKGGVFFWVDKFSFDARGYQRQVAHMTMYDIEQVQTYLYSWHAKTGEDLADELEALMMDERMRSNGGR